MKFYKLALALVSGGLLLFALAGCGSDPAVGQQDLQKAYEDAGGTGDVQDVTPQTLESYDGVDSSSLLQSK